MRNGPVTTGAPAAAAIVNVLWSVAPDSDAGLNVAVTPLRMLSTASITVDV
jgi:hypothetical protein